MWDSIFPKMFATNVALASPIGEPTCFKKRGWSDGIMEETDVWQTISEYLEKRGY